MQPLASRLISYMNTQPFVFATLLLVGAGCADKRSAKQNESLKQPSAISIKYARGFRVSSLGTSKLVQVTYPFQGATSGYSYLLVPKGEEPPPHEPGIRIVYVPVSSIVCTSTTHIPLLDYLGETDKLVGFPSTDYISSGKMRARIRQGKVVDLGVDKGLNMERLAVLKPDLVMGYTMSSDYGQFAKIEDLGIPVVINSEYLEQHPLGRAEWLKFMALFFNKEKVADSVFSFIEENYQRTKNLVTVGQGAPTVLSGIVYGDAWFLPAGENYAAKLFRDAGCHYLWRDTPGNGYLRISFESVYDKAHDADLWIGTGTYKTLDEIRAADGRYAKFKAFGDKQVYNYDARMGEKGGNEFLELGYLRPDLILQDLVKIAHPDVLPDYHLFFHRKLE